MDYLTNVFKQCCKKEFSELGFVSYKNNFYRVIGDVFQSFNLHKSISGYECTVEFAVVPLCAGDVIKKDYCSPNHVKMFENDYSWFSYDKNDDTSIDDCVNLMMGYMQKYLIPFFESSNNSQNAYFEICDFKKKHHKDGLSTGDYYLFCLSLKSGLFNLALEHLTAVKKQTEKAFERNKDCFGNQLNVEYEMKMTSKIKEIERQIVLISQSDIKGIEEFIANNELIALSNLGMR